jgi:hypothetical protein
MAMFVIAWLIVEYGKKQLKEENEYDLLYKEISGEINDRDKNQHNYDILMYKLGKLEKLTYKNKEKTSVLSVNFFMKFKAEAEKRI